MEIARFDPDVVGVYLNHNYWPPFPHDAAGQDDHRPVVTVRSADDRPTSAHPRSTILRARGAKVFFISPIPAGTISNPDPVAWSPIWHGYLPVLHAMHVPVADSAGPLEGPDGLRTETKPACNGAQHRVRPAGDLHLTRFGAGRAGTALAGYVAKLVHAHLRGECRARRGGRRARAHARRPRLLARRLRRLGVPLRRRNRSSPALGVRSPDTAVSWPRS